MINQSRRSEGLIAGAGKALRATSLAS